MFSVCGKLYKSETVNRMPRLFQKGMIHGEDADFNQRFWQVAQTVTVIPDSVYNYIINATSASTRFKGDSHLQSMTALCESLRQAEKQLLDSPDKFPYVRRVESYRIMTNIYMLYRTRGIKHLYWLKRIIKEADRMAPGWQDHLFGRFPAMFAKALKMGIVTAHIFLTMVAMIPSLRRQLRG